MRVFHFRIGSEPGRAGVGGIFSDKAEMMLTKLAFSR
jgi:hypothetical protein